jgi:hypothetical protein
MPVSVDSNSLFVSRPREIESVLSCHGFIKHFKLTSSFLTDGLLLDAEKIENWFRAIEFHNSSPSCFMVVLLFFCNNSLDAARFLVILFAYDLFGEHE